MSQVVCVSRRMAMCCRLCMTAVEMLCVTSCTTAVEWLCCRLYATFAGCLVDARCDDRRVAMPRGEPTQGSDISALVQDGCDGL